MKADLSKQVGPLPVWGWAVAVIGGIALALVARRSGLFGASSTSRATSSPEPEPEQPFLPYDAPGGAVVPLPGSGPTEGTDNRPTTNDEWRAVALRRLTSEGYGAFAVDRALGLWFASQDLNPQQAAIIDRALVLLGQPPDPPSVGPPVTPPVGTPEPSDLRSLGELNMTDLLKRCARKTTGHAVGGIPVESVFFEMARRGLTPADPRVKGECKREFSIYYDRAHPVGAAT